MPTPLDAEWLTEASRLAAALPEVPGLDYAVELRATDDQVPTWHQSVRDGRITSWALGPSPDPDLVLVLDDVALAAIHAPVCDATAALAATSVLGEDGRPHLPAPLDITENAEIHALPEIPDANLRVLYHLSAGPFGTTDTSWEFVDGRVARAELSAIDDPDVEVWVPFAKMTALRRGEITVLEALEDGGRVDGAVGPLMLLAGLHESDEMQLAQGLTGPSGPVLEAMGRLRATDPYQEVLQTLVERFP